MHIWLARSDALLATKPQPHIAKRRFFAECKELVFFGGYVSSNLPGFTSIDKTNINIKRVEIILQMLDFFRLLSNAF